MIVSAGPLWRTQCLQLIARRGLQAACVFCTFAAAVGGSAAVAQTGGSFNPAACPFEIEDPGAQRVECGIVAVPEHRGHPDGRTFDLSVVVLRSTADRPRADPVIFLSGGPGAAVTTNGTAYVNSSFVATIREQRDFIIWDQRGTGASEPALCPDLAGAFLRTQYGAEPSADRIRAAAAMVRTCRQRMDSEGIDVAAINSATSAQDLVDIRRALGYEEWNLISISYGTTLALTALRDAPEGIRAVALDGVAPPDVDVAALRPAGLARSLDLVFQQCGMDPACAAEFAHLEADFYATLDDLDAEPIELALNDPERFPEGRLAIDGRTFASGAFQALYSPDMIPLVPLLIREVRDRNEALLVGLVGALAPDPAFLSPFMTLSVDCFEALPLRSEQTLRSVAARHPRLAMIGDDQLLESVCSLWHDARADTVLLRSPIVSDIPALVTSGEFDPITPPVFARAVTEHLSAGRHFEIRGVGHGAVPTNPCGRSLMLAFLDDPRAPLDDTCVEERPVLIFETDIAVSAGMAGFAQRMREGPRTGRLIWAGGTLLVLVSAVLSWPVTWLVGRVRGRSKVGEATVPGRLIAGMTALAALAFAGGLAWIAAGVANPNTLAFGVPAPAAPLLWLPWVVLVLTVLSVGTVVFGPARMQSGRFAACYLLLVVAANVSFTILLGWIGFFSRS